MSCRAGRPPIKFAELNPSLPCVICVKSLSAHTQFPVFATAFSGVLRTEKVVHRLGEHAPFTYIWRPIFLKRVTPKPAWCRSRLSAHSSFRPSTEMAVSHRERRGRGARRCAVGVAMVLVVQLLTGAACESCSFPVACLFLFEAARERDSE